MIPAPPVDLASVLTPEVMAPILANAEVQQRLLPYLPSGESLPQSAEEIQNTLTSPQFQQVRPCLPWSPLLATDSHYTEGVGPRNDVAPLYGGPAAFVASCNPVGARCPPTTGDEHVQQCTGLRTAGTTHEPVWAAHRGRGCSQQGRYDSRAPSHGT